MLIIAFNGDCVIVELQASLVFCQKQIDQGNVGIELTVVFGILAKDHAFAVLWQLIGYPVLWIRPVVIIVNP
jgi:hypothetical protein